MPEGPKSAVFQSPDSGLYCPGPSSSSSRGPPSPVQDGRRDGWDRRDKSPDDRRLVFDVILTRYLCSLGLPSLPNWPTVSASQATVSAITATVSAYGMSLQSRQTFSGSAYQQTLIPVLGPLYLSIYQLFHIYLREEIQQKISQVSFSLTYAPREICGAYIPYKKIYISKLPLGDNNSIL